MAMIRIETVIGSLAIQGDDRGLTGISLPDSPPKKISTTLDGPKHIRLLQEAAVQLTEYLNGARTVFDLPLVLDDTPFRLRTWEIIRHIPYGRTMSYGDIAGRLGNRHYARAVGGAAHANPLPLVIPCHRVIGSDGSLTGFGGGLDVKSRLLHIEGIS